MQESQDELKNVLQEKLLEYEVGVPRASRDFIFASIGKPVRTGFPKKLLYSAVLFLSLGSYFVYENAFSDNNGKTGATEHDVVAMADGAVPAIAIQASQENAPSDDTSTTSDNNSVAPVATGPTRRADAGLEMFLEETFGAKARNEQQAFTAAPVVESPDPISRVREDKTDESMRPENTSAAIMPESTRKVRFNVSVMPLLAFSHVVPNAGDGATLSGFSSPSSFSPSRLGARVAFSFDYETKGNRFLYAGLSYFNYNTAFKYSSDESVGDIASTNVIDQRMSGFGLSAGARYPLKISAEKRHFITGGLEAQLLTSRRPGLTSATQLMLNVGYASEIKFSKGFIRLQPTISYSLTSIQYPGLHAHPYWVGFDVSYVWPR